jgi:ankyrin repeat protein
MDIIGDVEQLRIYIEMKGLDINSKISNSTLLYWAANLGYVESVKLLVEKGAKLNEKNNLGDTALMAAVLHFDIRPEANTGIIVKILIDAGANVNILDNKNNSPLLLAAYKKNKEIIRMLIDAGAKDYPNLQGQTALQIASEKLLDKDIIDSIKNVKVDGGFYRIKTKSAKRKTKSARRKSKRRSKRKLKSRK